MHEPTAEKLPFKGGEFEGVLVRHLLEHLKDPRKVLEEACRVCSRTLVVVFSQLPNQYSTKQIRADNYLGAERWSHPSGGLEAVISCAGFRKIDKENYSPDQKHRLIPRESVWTCSRRLETRSAL